MGTTGYNPLNGNLPAIAAARAKAVGQPPPLAPDATDEALKQAKRSQLAVLLSGQGRKSTFVSGTPTGGSSVLGG